ncbi:acyl-CoA dehydrogenase family protein [Alloalcanivorax xenomutans]|jgi:acyl-CoA dehydrogenase|uniref:Acyl-[acyl-carrier-protein] dehydrogenase MbtN n=2 Tax=Alloalcanivorax xenomutans TaxID=1094342 RepID=A0A9Q3ZHL4_9GAMM|nr:acyl-CoA dehydrogenase family protein [Alloalcanivorax xenomutans]KYZ85308.1 acyl-CoA dehydrogenase [Alcanivorax sp. KX64203]MAO61016.1 acyl-CoA dehydrogenase [Alcanivorax sp.]MAY11019.1 acyl-CoA dehydrogenase [Alcanivorax sp.]MBA4721438.1 acyl-CoA dehydrogenase family protein [Alcanivorax sp.]MBI54098.1 acyl-CoA dehydrogenase [Alcanivorax sp.]|tara:strand:- start:499 stop:1659 length:1161 start_codon:yes stop_codon:yes gene_type:complete
MSELFPDYKAPWEAEDHTLLRDQAAKFFAREVTPNQERWAEQHQVDRELWNKSGAAGLLCTGLPDEYGGGGGNFGHEAVVQEELALARDTAFGFSVHSTIVAHYIAAYATEAQKQRWIPAMANGDKVIGIAMTEPGTGSDLQAVRTTAIRDGDHYVINGSKTFISNATHADLMVVVAKTDTSEGARGISLFVVEVDKVEGYERGRVLQKVGQHGQDTRELAFIDMRVPAENLLGGKEGQGFFQLMEQLPRERLIIGIAGVAMAEAAVLEAIKYAKVRTAFGKPILDFQNTRFVLAECKTEVLAAKTFMDHCVQRYMDGDLDPATASMAKLLGTDKQVAIIDRCLQVFGGYGYLMEYPIAQMYAAARVQKIYGGTNEIMKELIGRSL